MKKRILLFGSAYMAEEYLKVLSTFNCEVSVIGRNKDKAAQLAEKYKASGYGDGIDALKSFDPQAIDLVIVASAIESFNDIIHSCIEKGLKRILVEKPGAISLSQLEELSRKIRSNNVLRIAYNRRFYNSVSRLKQRIDEDGGAIAAFFDFTDREKDILNSPKSSAVLKKWGLVNSTHVIDTIFHLIGFPEELSVMRSGGWDRHPSGSIFVGCGKTKQCLFSYFSSWSGGGRWNIEVSTREGRYRLSPLEELQFCKKNQFKWEQIELRDLDDKKFKPGLYKMVNSALSGENFDLLPDIDEQVTLAKAVNRIFGYDD